MDWRADDIPCGRRQPDAGIKEKPGDGSIASVLCGWCAARGGSCGAHSLFYLYLL